MKEFIEIPFGAKDSELCGWEYTIPEGFVASIENGKIVVKKEESEDERIRKRILLSLEKDLIATKNSGCNIKDLEECIAWLEKQGEQKPAELPKVKNVPLSFKEKLGNFMQYTSVDLEKGENQQLLDEAAKELLQLAYSDKANEIALASAKTWEESMAILMAANNAYRRGQKEQKPAWSKEDNGHVQIISDIIEDKKKDQLYHIGIKVLNNEIVWLKSLKDRVQPQWKPSEEQLTILLNAANGNYMSDSNRQVLSELYRNLKQL